MTEEGIDALSKPVVAIGGLGGIGGVMFLAMVRLGIRRFRVSENGIFDPPDMNRQVGAYESTMGKPKLDVYVQLARDINPDIELELVPEGLSAGNLEAFLKGSDVYVGIIDVEKGFDVKAKTPELLKKFNIPLFTSGAIGFGTIMINHHPQGMMPDEFWDLVNAQSQSTSGALPSVMSERFNRITMERIDKTAAETGKYATTSIGANMAGTLMASEVTAYLLRDTPLVSREIVFAPKYMIVDLMNLTMEVRDATRTG
ncbi:MAG: ThiF family adenylyltransferase [Methanoregula sp.]|uniref:ThiF family adenylyltransferase n=1 Tax=Methanoregula sp. TaxID=2052170 RepID=UPI0025F56C88|nr:ThiF family adenylyltransferase [Methanoregula sp.]MCK9630238.1 ThiF family adenylyltransferase [Methanoregula sp.]